MNQRQDSRHEIPYAAEVWRKALHLIALIVPLGMAYLGKPDALYILIPLAIIALLADWMRVRVVWFSNFIGILFGSLMRLEERPPLGGPVVINGATWILVTAVLLGLIFPIRIAAVSFALFMVADAAAALVGRRFGRHRWPSSSRTVEGSMAFLATGLLFAAFLPGVVFWTVAVASLAATVAEIPSRPFNDNVRTPLVAATVLFLLERFVLDRPISLFL